MRKNKKAAILIYMLGVIAILGLVVTEFLIEAAGEVRYRSQVSNRTDLPLVAQSVLDTTLAVINEINKDDEGLYAPQQGWGRPLQYSKITIPDGYKVDVTVTDETGKVSLYSENTQPMEMLLGALGLSYENIQNIKGSLKEWLKKSNKEAYPPNNISKSSDSQSSSSEPRRVYDFLELEEIDDFKKVFFDENDNPNELFFKFKESVSLYHDKSVNINTAPTLLRNALLGQTTVEESPNQEYARSYEDLRKAPPAGVRDYDFKAVVFNISITISRGPVRYFLNAIVKFNGGDKNTDSKQPFSILALTEDQSSL